MLPERPFFIVGTPRSGTTLLRFILSSHPRIYIPAETGFLPFLRLNTVSRLSQKQIRRLFNRIARLNRHWQSLVQEANISLVSRTEPSLEQLLDTLYRLKIAQEDPHALRWGDKTPSYVRYISQVNRIFPQAQFVHMIRDGRDAALSARSKWGKERWHMDLYYLLNNWIRNVEAGRRAGKRLNSNHYTELHYEQLVHKPEEVLKRLCSFLNEDFHPALLSHSNLAQDPFKSGSHSEVRQAIFGSSVGRWRNEMSLFEKKMANHLAGFTLAQFGYRLDETPPLSRGDHCRLLPLAMKCRMVNITRAVLTNTGLWSLNRDKRR